MSQENATPASGDVAIVAFKEGGTTVYKYVMYKSELHAWFDARSVRYPESDTNIVITPLMSAPALFDFLDFPEPFPYTPQRGDVARWKRHPTLGGETLFCVPGGSGVWIWMTENGSRVTVDHTDTSRFTLLVRDGVPVSASPASEEPETPEPPAPYRPSLGDVALVTLEGFPHTVQYRRQTTVTGRIVDSPQWIDEDGLIRFVNPERTPSFRLVVSGNALVGDES